MQANSIVGVAKKPRHRRRAGYISLFFRTVQFAFLTFYEFNSIQAIKGRVPADLIKDVLEHGSMRQKELTEQIEIRSKKVRAIIHPVMTGRYRKAVNAF